MTIEPTTRQLEIHAYMLEYVGRQGAPPTLREICDRFEFGSTNAATDHLKSMMVKGIVRKCDVRKGGRGSRCYVPVNFAAGPGTRPRATLVVERARGTEIEIAYAGDSITDALAAVVDRPTWRTRLTRWRSGAALERWERCTIGLKYLAFQRFVRPDARSAWRIAGDPVSRLDLERALGRGMS